MTGEQLGFGFDEMAEEARTAHIPNAMDAGIPYYHSLIEKHHAAMIAGDTETSMTLRREAHDLAVKLNHGEPGILAGPEAPGYVLERETAAPVGTVPLWGQIGEYTIKVGDMAVKIEQDGIFGTGAFYMTWPGFAAHVIDPDKPFLSETGYRSFLGIHAEMVPGITPDRFAAAAIKAYLAKECKGKLRKVGQTYVDRIMAERQSEQQQVSP